MAILLRSIRAHHWCKNVLIFLPIFFAHQVSDWSLFTQAALGFVAFCLAASSVYVFNDIIDLQNDQQHFQKKLRPLAAGQMSVNQAWLLMLILGTLAVICAWNLSFDFLKIIFFYFILNILYSVYLKHILLVDVFVLASFYVLRVLAGDIATGIEASNWLLMFCVFFFVSLAFLKRYVDVYVNRFKSIPYADVESFSLVSLGTASGYIAVLVLALYINRTDVTILYRSPQYLWLVCALILFWISRLWIIVVQKKITIDPIVFMFKDVPSYVVLCLTVVFAVVAT